MEDKLREFDGKKIDVNCGTGAIFRGIVENVASGLLTLKDETAVVVFISIESIIAVTECSEPTIRPGFIG